MLTLQGQTIPVVIWDPVFEIYKIIKSGSGCFFYVYMVRISMKKRPSLHPEYSHDVQPCL